MLGPVVAAAMLQRLVAFGEDARGAVAVAAFAAAVLAVGLFGVVAQRAPDAKHQAIVEVQAEFVQCLFYLVQTSMCQVIAEVEMDRRQVQS